MPRSRPQLREELQQQIVQAIRHRNAIREASGAAQSESKARIGMRALALDQRETHLHHELERLSVCNVFCLTGGAH